MLVRLGRPFTGGRCIEHITCSVHHTAKVNQYESLESNKASERVNNGTISYKEALEMKVISRSQVGLGDLFIRKYNKKDSLKVARQN